jgi:hypothetical protein
MNKNPTSDVFNLRSFDLSLGFLLPPSLQFDSPLCIATQITDGSWSEESFLLFIHTRGTEKRSYVGQTHLLNI